MFKISRFLLACALTVGYLLGSPALAQNNYDPSTVADQQASGAYNHFGQHTGTDVIQFGGKSYQLMTWDDAGSGLVYLSLSVNGAAPTPPQIDYVKAVPASMTKLSDPDVVMAVKNGTLYANLVYLAANPATNTRQTYYDAYVLDASTNTFSRVPGFNPIALGATTFGSVANHLHSSPNIDANNAGNVAIVWQETYVDKGYVVSTFPSFTVKSNVRSVFAEVYGVTGDITGSITKLCNRSRGTRLVAYSNQLQTPNVLYNTSTKPDVAIGNEGVISATFINTYAKTVDVPGVGTDVTDPDYVAATTRVEREIALVVNQYNSYCEYNVPTENKDGVEVPINQDEWGQGLVHTPDGYPEPKGYSFFAHHEWYKGVSDGTPRIAAPSTSGLEYSEDFEVVLDWTDYGCPTKIGPVVYHEIHNWGKNYDPATQLKTFRSGFTVVSPPLVFDESTTPTMLPVVDYYPTRPATPDANVYVVTWMAKNYPVGDAFDIWGRTFIAGVPQSNHYGRINGPDIDGHQSVPSVSARHSGAARDSYHLFNDESTRQQLSFKELNDYPGGDAFTTPGGNKSAAPIGHSAPAGKLQAYPNPFSNAVEFSLGLRPQEQVQQLVVTDMLGRVVEQVAVPVEQASNQHLSWQPKQRLPEGSYQVRLMTNQRTETLRLNKH